ncbi:MAG: GntR family transcriptional regulator, partial [Vulcanimicrobiaceae bacterium]
MALPAYLRILRTLRNRIAGGTWGVGDQIPTDEALMRQFGVSRFTVRAALDVLVADGVIKRYRKRGTFVLARPDASTWMLTSLGDLVSSGFPTPPIVLEAITTRCQSHIANALGVSERSRVLQIRVQRETGGEPYAYSIIHIPERFAKKLPRNWHSRLGRESLIELVSAANAERVHKAIQIADAVPATSALAPML